MGRWRRHRAPWAARDVALRRRVRRGRKASGVRAGLGADLLSESEAVTREVSTRDRNAARRLKRDLVLAGLIAPGLSR
jgi:hypothetical protein